MKKRILFVDDEPNLLQGLKRSLRSMRQEWDMSFAENGYEALQLLAISPFDVVVTDIFMPEKEGLETIIEVRRTFPTTKIVAISGGGRQGNLIHALDVAERLGAHCTLQKPFNANQMISIVHEAMQV